MHLCHNWIIIIIKNINHLFRTFYSNNYMINIYEYYYYIMLLFLFHSYFNILFKIYI